MAPQPSLPDAEAAAAAAAQQLLQEEEQHTAQQQARAASKAARRQRQRDRERLQKHKRAAEAQQVAAPAAPALAVAATVTAEDEEEVGQERCAKLAVAAVGLPTGEGGLPAAQSASSSPPPGLQAAHRDAPCDCDVDTELERRMHHLGIAQPAAEPFNDSAAAGVQASAAERQRALAEVSAAAGPPAWDVELLTELRCPITQEAMHDPVLAADGETYERSAVEGAACCGQAKLHFFDSWLSCW
jgi:Tfp pilus assembly protein PilE